MPPIFLLPLNNQVLMQVIPTKELSIAAITPLLWTLISLYLAMKILQVCIPLLTPKMKEKSITI